MLSLVCFTMVLYFGKVLQQAWQWTIPLIHHNIRGSQTATSSRMRVMNQEAASSSAECSRDKLPFSFVRRQDSIMWESCCKDTDQCLQVVISFCMHCLVPVPCITVQQRPLLPREVETHTSATEVIETTANCMQLTLPGTVIRCALAKL